MSRLVQQNFENDVYESICLLDADSSSYPRVDDDFTVWRMAMKHETGLIIFISQISRSNSKGSFYAFDNNKRFSSESYYSERIGLPQVVICPGNGVKINNVLQNIQNVECSFRSNGGKSETSMDVVKEKMVSMRMLDGTYESGIGCYSVKGSNFKVSSMYDIAYCEVFFKVPEFKGNFFAELMDLRDDQSRIYFTSNEYEFHNNRPHNPKTITDPKDMALYWHRMEPLHVTITDVDIIQLQSRNKNHNHGEYAWFQGRVVEKIPYEFVNFTANPTYFNNHPVLSFTYGYGNWFTPQLKEYKVYPPSMAVRTDHSPFAHFLHMLIHIDTDMPSINDGFRSLATASDRITVLPPSASCMYPLCGLNTLMPKSDGRHFRVRIHALAARSVRHVHGRLVLPVRLANMVMDERGNASEHEVRWTSVATVLQLVLRPTRPA